MHACVLGHFSRVRLFATPWTAAHQAPLSTGFPRQEYWSLLPFSSLGDRPHPGMEPGSPALAGGFFTTEPLRKPLTGIGPCKARLHTRDLFLKIWRLGCCENQGIPQTWLFLAGGGAGAGSWTSPPSPHEVIRPLVHLVPRRTWGLPSPAAGHDDSAINHICSGDRYGGGWGRAGASRVSRIPSPQGVDTDGADIKNTE